MGVSADVKCCSDFGRKWNDCPITAEDIHKVLLEAYDILTDCKLCFDEKKEKLYCLEKKYRCYIDTVYPYTFKYYKDCYGYEYFFFIATVNDFAIDLVAYWDLTQWTVLNTGSCYRTKKNGGCSKLQYAVSKRQDFVGKEKEAYELKLRQIERIKADCDFCYNKNTVIDWRCKPKCQILEPCDNTKCDDKLPVLIKITNWCLSCDGKHAKLFIDNCEVATLYDCNLVIVDLADFKKGWHKLKLKLYDECCKEIGVACEKHICLRKPKKCEDKCEKKCKKDKCDDKCEKKCKKDKCDKKDKCKKKCDDSSSSSSCSSSSSSSCPSSSCSSESSAFYNFESSYCCDSSSSSSCSSSSSSSCSSSSSSSSCSSSSSSSDCCPSSSSSSSCPSSSSSSDYLLKCKKYVKKKDDCNKCHKKKDDCGCDKKKHHKYY